MSNGEALLNLEGIDDGVQIGGHVVVVERDIDRSLRCPVGAQVDGKGPEAVEREPVDNRLPHATTHPGSMDEQRWCSAASVVMNGNHHTVGAGDV